MVPFFFHHSPIPTLVFPTNFFFPPFFFSPYRPPKASKRSGACGGQSALAPPRTRKGVDCPPPLAFAVVSLSISFFHVFRLIPKLLGKHAIVQVGSPPSSLPGDGVHTTRSRHLRRHSGCTCHPCLPFPCSVPPLNTSGPPRFDFDAPFSLCPPHGHTPLSRRLSFSQYDPPTQFFLRLPHTPHFSPSPMVIPHQPPLFLRQPDPWPHFPRLPLPLFPFSLPTSGPSLGVHLCLRTARAHAAFIRKSKSQIPPSPFPPSRGVFLQKVPHPRAYRHNIFISAGLSGPPTRHRLLLFSVD